MIFFFKMNFPSDAILFFFLFCSRKMSFLENQDNAPWQFPELDECISAPTESMDATTLGFVNLHIKPNQQHIELDTSTFDENFDHYEDMSLVPFPVEPFSPIPILSPTPPPPQAPLCPSLVDLGPPPPFRNKKRPSKPIEEPSLKSLTFDPKKVSSSSLARDQELFAEQLKNMIRPAIPMAAKRRQRLTIYLVPEAFETQFERQHQTKVETNKKSESAFPSPILKSVNNLIHCILKESKHHHRQAITYRNNDEEDTEEEEETENDSSNESDSSDSQPSRRGRKRSRTQSCPSPAKRQKTTSRKKKGGHRRSRKTRKTINIPLLQLPILIYTRMKYENKYFPDGKMYAILHRFQNRTEVKGQKRHLGSIFIPAIQKDFESFWHSMSHNDRYQWSLDDTNCPLRVRKFSEIVKFTLLHRPFLEEVRGPAHAIFKDLPPGPKLWFVSHEPFHAYDVSVFDCSEENKILSNLRFRDELYEYGALSKGRVKGPYVSVVVPSSMQNQPPSTKKPLVLSRR